MNKEKHVCIRFNGFSIDVNVDAELYKKYCSIVWQEHGLGGVKEEIGKHMAEIVTKFDGKVGGLDSFLDPNHVPEPSLKEGYQKKIDYLKTQNNDTISDMRDEFYRLHIICKALLDCDDKKKFNMDYVAAWNRYK